MRGVFISRTCFPDVGQQQDGVILRTPFVLDLRVLQYIDSLVILLTLIKTPTYKVQIVRNCPLLAPHGIGLQECSPGIYGYYDARTAL